MTAVYGLIISIIVFFVILILVMLKKIILNSKYLISDKVFSILTIATFIDAIAILTFIIIILFNSSIMNSLF